MSKMLGRALVVALLACTWPALGPAGGAHAVGRPCAGSAIHVAIVVDFGDVMSTTSTCIAAGDRDNGADILHARAQALGKPAPRFNGSGLMCAIDGYPETGCAEKTGDTIAYWSYWHGINGTWEYSQQGATARVHADYVEGWRWQPASRNESVPPPRGSASATTICVPAPPATEAPAPPPTVAAAARTTSGGGPAPTAAPASPTTARGATRPTTATTVAGAAATTAPSTIASETTAPPTDGSSSTPSTASTDDDERDTEDIAARSTAADDDDGGGGGAAPVGLILGVVLIAAIGGGAFFVQRRRASS